jgi:hypothetical protein
MTDGTLEDFYAQARQLEPREALVRRVVADTVRPSRPSRTARRAFARRRLVAGVVLAAAAVIVATALGSTFGVVHLTDPGRQLVDTVPAITTASPSSLGAPEPTHLYCRANNREIEAPVTGGDPTVACGALWRQGMMTGTKQAPPQLQACVASNGVIDVYPGANACAAAGRPVAAPYTAADLQAIKLSNALMAWVTSVPRGCVTVAQGAAKATALLQQIGMANDGWQIATDDQASNGDDGKQCVVPTVFGAKKTILLD